MPFDNSLTSEVCSQDADCLGRYKCYTNLQEQTRVCGCNRSMLASGEGCQQVHPLAIIVIGLVVLVMFHSLFYGATVCWLKWKHSQKSAQKHRKTVPRTSSAVACWLLFLSNTFVTFNSVIMFARLWPVPFERFWYDHGQPMMYNLANTAGISATILIGFHFVQQYADGRKRFSSNGNGRLSSWKWCILAMYLTSAAVDYARGGGMMKTNQTAVPSNGLLDKALWFSLSLTLSVGASRVKRALEHAEALSSRRAQEQGAPGPSSIQSLARFQAVKKLSRLAEQLRWQVLGYTLAYLGFFIAEKRPFAAPVATLCVLGIHVAVQCYFLIMYDFLAPRRERLVVPQPPQEVQLWRAKVRSEWVREKPASSCHHASQSVLDLSPFPNAIIGMDCLSGEAKTSGGSRVQASKQWPGGASFLPYSSDNPVHYFGPRPQVTTSELACCETKGGQQAATRKSSPEKGLVGRIQRPRLQANNDVSNHQATSSSCFSLGGRSILMPAAPVIHQRVCRGGRIGIARLSAMSAARGARVQPLPVEGNRTNQIDRGTTSVLRAAKARGSTDLQSEQGGNQEGTPGKTPAPYYAQS